MRKAMDNMSQTLAALSILVNSSSQKPSKFGPRSRSGSSALNKCATPPFGHTMRLVDGSNEGLSAGEPTDRIPLGPSTQIRRKLSAVGAMIPIWRRRPDIISARTHSADDLVFPEPRPPSSNQVRHG